MTNYACKSCGLFGCSCSPGANDAPCPVCRRGRFACVCKSHVPVAPRREDEPQKSAEEAKTRAKKVEIAVREALLCYYSRDAQGLESLVRRIA